ncbi:MAG TPA: G1 family glutamic endopeptidase [Streptosporangiaceae bacterium]|nr:G1 family glutamic endopeptidase [Streptosporangiaceae bacterium]
MLRRWPIALAGLGALLGSAIAASPAAAAPAGPHAAHLVRPAAQLARPAGHGTRPLVSRGGPAGAAQSTNWSGYAAASGTYTSVSASWTVPAGTCRGSAKYSSFWVGLDGYNSTTVEQTGSEVDCSGSKAKYYSWYEMYPARPVNFSNPVRPGDRFSGAVTYNGGSSYTLVLQDLTKGWKHTVSATLAGAANSSAEVIAEAPCCTASGGILPLAHFSPVTFTSATVDGSAIGSFSPAQIVMVDGSGRAKDSVSGLRGGSSFTATWLRAN